MEKIDKALELETVEMDEKGFTLIELIVVMAIIGVLVLLAAPRFLGYTKDAKATALRQDAAVISDAVMLYNIDNDDEWPVENGVLAEEGTAIDATLLEDYIKSTDNPVEEFVIVNDEGDVKHTVGTPDKDNNQIFSNLDQYNTNSKGGAFGTEDEA